MIPKESEIDGALLRFQKFRAYSQQFLNQHYSEADTRVKFVDRLLVNVLGWSEFDNIKREENYTQDKEKRCIDYKISLSVPVLVVEAKKLLRRFEIPTDREVTIYSMSGIVRNWTEAWVAIQQARAYCDAIGARYALVTNGTQFIVFRSISDGKAWDKLKFLAFASLDVVEQNFQVFYECLARSQIQRDILSGIALDVPVSSVRIRPRSFIPPYSGGYRNEAANDIEQHFRSMLLDLPEPTREFLDACYSTSIDDTHSFDRLNTLLADPLPTFCNPVEAVRPGDHRDPFSKRFVGLEMGAARPLVVVMGGTGVGKTTFLNWFLKRGLDHQKQQSLIVAWSDFRTIVCEPDQVFDRTIDDVLQNLLRASEHLTNSFAQQREVFKEDISKALCGVLQPWATDSDIDKKIGDHLAKLRENKRTYIERLVQYLTVHCQRTVVLVLDNMDQHSDELQRRVYKTGHEISLSCKAITIVSLREASFRRQIRTRSFDAYSHMDFHVRSRPIAAVLERRFDYMASQGKRVLLHVTAAGNINYEVTLCDLLDVLKRSFCSNEDSETTECLQCLANSNLRRQLRLCYRFLVSGQTKLAEYLGALVERGMREIPFHEFLHSVILGDRRYFDQEEDDEFLNIFEPAPSGTSSHFTALRILAYLHYELGQEGDLRNNDFLETGVIVNAMEPLGVTREEVSFHVGRMEHFGLLLPDSEELSKNVMEQPCALTKCGLYYLTRLYSAFAYFALMGIDTSLHDERIARDIGLGVKETIDVAKMPLVTRAAAAAVFVEYLSKKETVELATPSIRNRPVFAQHTFTAAMQASLADVERTLSFA